MSSSIVPLRKHPSGRAPSLELPQWWVLKNSMLWHHRWCSGCNLKHKGSACDQDHMLWLQTHLCDYRHTYATGVSYWWCHLWLESRIREWRHNMRLEMQLCNCSRRKFTRGHAHQNSICSRPFWSDFSFPSHVLLYFYTSNIDSSSM
jgi:hypothetical protein